MKSLLPVDKINTRFAVLVKVEKFKRKDVISITQIKNFMKDIPQFIIPMHEKMFEKSTLGSSIVKDANIFKQDLQLELSKEKLINHLKVLLKHFMTLNVCNPTQWDQPLTDFSMFHQNELQHAKLDGSKFEKGKDGLDAFHVKELQVLPYKELSFVIKIILTMSHE